jgi:hypothetical protein
MENEELGNEGNSTKTPPIILTFEANLISLQRELRSAVTGEFFLRNTATGTWITTKSMMDYNAIQKFLTEKNLHFFTFYTKADKPVKAIIRHFPGNISAVDITVALQKIDYNIISVKQMTAKSPTPEGGVSLSLSLSHTHTHTHARARAHARTHTHTSLPLFLVMPARNQKAPEIFKLTTLCNRIKGRSL